MAAASRPPSAAPSEKPQNMIITMVARRRRGLNSEVKAMAFGIAPPRPSPVKSRITSSESASAAKNGRQRAEAERECGENDDLPAADAVRERTENERTDHQAEQARAQHRAELRLAEPPFAKQRRA